MDTTDATPPPAADTRAARPQRGDELELTVDSLAYGGAGVARTDGYVVFVSGAVPGDRVRAVIGKRKRAWAEARTVEILAPSPDRIAPVADHPGAPWQILPYERQLEVKQSQVDDALRRIGKLDGLSSSRSSPRSSSGATETSSSIRSAPTPTASSRAAFTPRAVGTRSCP